MRKANKKLASAIVLGLMLAVPVGVSAADHSGQDVTQTGSGDRFASADGNGVTNAVTNFGNIVLDGDWKNNAFIGASGGTLTVSGGNSISIQDTVDQKTFGFHGYNGTVNVSGVKDVTLTNVYKGLKAQVGDGNNLGSGLVDFDLTGDLNITAHVGIIAANYNKDTAADSLTATVNVDADNVVINRIDGAVGTTGGAAQATEYDNNFAIVSVSKNYSDGDGIYSNDYAGTTSVNINANSIKIYADSEKDNYGAILAANGVTEDKAGVTMSANDIYIEGDIVADTNANIGIGGKGDGTSHTAVIKGDVKSNNSKISLDLGTNGSLTGTVTSTGTNGVSLDMGEGSVWNVTGVSTVNTITGEGAVKIDSTEVDSVKIDSAGDGITYGNTAAVTDTFKTAEDAKKYFDMITVNGKEISTYTADAGAVFGEIEVSSDGTVKEGVNANNQGISEMASIGLMAWRAENNDMNKRLGELRNSNGEHGVWARMVRGESEYGAQSIKNVYNTYQLGYDEKLSTNDHWTVGAAISYTDAQSSFATGSGENTSKGLSFYGSYLGDNGEFVDLIAKYARLDNEFDVVGSGAGSGDYSTNGYSFSAEFGKRNQLANDFYFEPQVELTYGRVADVDYVTSKEVKVSQDAMDSLVGRVGFAAGKNIKNGNVYVRASYLYDFDGETSVSFVKDEVPRTFEEDLGGGWFEFGIGTNINLSDATYLYLDVEKTTGGEVDTNWQWNAGVRYSF